jgi:hypothetical protein
MSYDAARIPGRQPRAEAITGQAGISESALEVRVDRSPRHATRPRRGKVSHTT